MKVLDQIHFPLSFTWPIDFLRLFGHPCSSGTTKPGAEITEAMLFEQISSSRHRIWGYHFCAVLQSSHFWLHLHFGLPPRTCPPCKPSPVRSIIPREQQHCFFLGLALWNPILGSGGTLHEGSNVVLQFLHLF